MHVIHVNIVIYYVINAVFIILKSLLKMSNAWNGQIKRGSEPPPLGKSQVVIGFLRNNGTEPPREQIGSRGRFVQPSVKYVDD